MSDHSGDPERRSPPSILLVVLAMFGLASVQKFTGSAPGPDPGATAKGEEKAAPAYSPSGPPGAETPDQPEARILRPLLDYFRTGPDGKDPLGSAFNDTKVGRKHRLRFLIACVPDPVQTTNSHRFDEWIGAIQRACESEGFVLGGFRMPWGSGAPSAKGPDRPGTEPKAGAKSEANRATGSIVPYREPGLLLFRGKRSDAGIHPLLAVLLVPETPTLGLDKVSLATCLDLAASWDFCNRYWVGTRTFRVLGPIFSGSQTSLEQTLRNWTTGPGKGRANTFEIISGSASAISVERLTKCVEEPHKVNFSATVHENQALVDALLEYIAPSAGDIAILVEANTRFGRQSQPSTGRGGGGKPAGGLLYYPFPLHISKIRGLYDKQGLLRDQEAGTLRTFEHLRIPFEEAGDATDIPPMQTPGFTTSVDELVLGQILADIAHRKIRTVGIIATDPLDVIFLAKEVRQFLPDVRLFATQSYLLFTHPQNVGDLRGMVVASTYPLFPPNQLWSYSYQGDATHVFFSSESAQGTYNAAVAHLEEIGDERIPARFLEYGLPFDPPGSYVPAADKTLSWDTKKRKPPIWLGMIGNKGIYPLKTVKNRYNIQSIVSAKQVCEIPEAGNRLIILAFVSHVLHIRIFDHVGEMILDTDEGRLPEQAAQIGDLRKQLEDLGPLDELSESDRGRVVDAVTSIVGRPRYLYEHDQREEEYTEYFEPPGSGDAARHAESWARIRDWFRPQFQQIWLFLFYGLSVACLVWAGIGGLVCWWVLTGKVEREPEAFRIGPLSTAGLAQFLNCCRADGSAREAACRGPGPYLPVALVLLLLVYLTITAPHLDVTWRIPWIPLNPLRDHDFWVIGVAYVVCWLTLASLVLSVIAWRVMARRERRRADAAPGDGGAPAAVGTPGPRRRARVSTFVILFILVVSALPPLIRIARTLRQHATADSFEELSEGRRDALLRLARNVAIPSGVSPVLSLLFIGVAGLAWVHAQLKRRFLIDQFTPGTVATVAAVGGQVLSGDRITMRSIQEERGRIDAVLTSPARPLLTTHIIGSVVVAVLVQQFLFPVITVSGANALLFIALFLGLLLFLIYQFIIRWGHGRSPRPIVATALVLLVLSPFVIRSIVTAASYDLDRWSNAFAGLLIAVLFGLLSSHTLQLVVLWGHVRKLMNLMLHLPLVAAMDRIPPRVSGWFSGAPRSGDARFELIRRQAQALSHRGEGNGGAVKTELEAVLGRKIAAHSWKKFNRSLEDLRPNSVGDVIVPIREYLLECWKPATIQATFPDASGGKPGGTSAGDALSSELHNIAMAVSQGVVPTTEPPKRLPEWVQLAEDLMTMLYMRWLAVALAQVWTLIGFLVVGSLALLLAISSYPFPFQSGLLFGMGLLIGALVLMILVVVVGFNRDELISRLSNTAPNRLKLDYNLMGGLFTYIVPLAGALAAMSFESADTIRSLLDPILRHLR